MESTAVDLGQAPEPFGFEQLDGALKLREVLLQPSVRKIGQRFTSERFDDRSELAHERIPSNMRSMLPAPLGRGCDCAHVSDRKGAVESHPRHLLSRPSRRSHFRGAERPYFVLRVRLIGARRSIGRTTHR